MPKVLSELKCLKLKVKKVGVVSDDSYMGRVAVWWPFFCGVMCFLMSA